MGSRSWRLFVVGAAVVAVVAALGAVLARHSEPSRPRPRGAVIHDYRRAHAAAAAVIQRNREGAVTRAAGIRRAARGCLRDWRAAPPERLDTLFALYRVATAQPSLPGQIRATERWLGALRRIDDLDRVARLADARLRLA